MFAPKCIVLAAFVALACNVELGSASGDKSHHLVVGSRLPGDKLSMKENIVKSSSWLRIVTVEKTFYVQTHERITQVQALDQKTNGNGAYASLVGGGPGHNFVTLRFKSQRSHGINFVVEIFSRV
ncbi:hypothetical protein KM043_003627 [Ampulex compressa]|nr:hypothetical protein KM043_003627 [Ampulex compressa]